MHRDLGNAFFKAMDYDRAIVEYTTAINIGSQVYGDNAKSLFPTVYYARGNAYLAKKDFLKALVDYQHISANRFPDTAEAYYNRGYAFFINGNTDMAAADFERALGIDPNIDRNINDTGVQEFIETQVRITGEETQSTSSPTEL
jgi:tetratricopeptide (TPR) repeat protein